MTERRRELLRLCARPSRLCRTGVTREECEREMRDAVAFHVGGLRDAGERIPEPSNVCATFVSVAA